MITCVGLAVGIVESVYTQDVLNKCAKWLKNHKYLLDINPDFIIDGQVYCTVIDSYIDSGEVFILCRMYDGFTKIGTSKEVI